jgi:hypothetical protein
VSLGSWRFSWVHPRNRILPMNPGMQLPPDQTALFRTDYLLFPRCNKGADNG